MTTMFEFQKTTSENNINIIIESIEKVIEGYKTGRFYPWVSVIIDGEFSFNDRNTVANKYINEGGWYAVFHKTSSENGERYGLTEFNLFTPESYEKWKHSYSKDYITRGHLMFNV